MRRNAPGPASTKIRGVPSSSTRKLEPALPNGRGPPEPSTTTSRAGFAGAQRAPTGNKSKTMAAITRDSFSMTFFSPRGRNLRRKRSRAVLLSGHLVVVLRNRTRSRALAILVAWASGGHRGEQRLDFGVQILCHFHGFRAAVGIQETGHGVVRKMHSVRPLVEQNRYRRVRTGVRNALDHFLHDQRIANDEPQDFWRRSSTFFAQDFTQVKTCELHEPGRAGGHVNDALYFGIGFCRGDIIS